MEKYIEIIKKQRRLLLVVFLLLNIVSLIGITRIRIRTGFDIFMPDTSVYAETAEKMESYFPGSENILFIIPTGVKNLEIELMQKLYAFQKQLGMQEHVLYANGPAPEMVMSGRQLIRMSTLTPASIEALTGYYRELGRLSPIITYDGELYAVFEAFPSKNFTFEDVKEIQGYLTTLDLPFVIAGESYMQLKIFDYILRILLIIPPCALLLILLVFRTQMRSLKATVFSVLPAGIGALWTMGIIGWLGNSITIITVLAPIFTIVIGSADGLHFVSHVQDEEERKHTRTEALGRTLRMVGVPMIITTITSMVGFLVLMVMNNSAIRSLALFASLGILLAGIATWFVLPLILSGNVSLGKSRTKKEKARAADTKGLRVFWGWPSLVLVILLLLTAGVGITQLSTEFTMLSLYKQSTDVQKGFNVAMNINGGSVPLFLFVEHGDNPLEPYQANLLEELSGILEKSGLAGKSVSFPDLLARMHGGIQGIAPVYPDDLKTAQSLNNILARRADNPLVHLVDPQQRVSRVIVFPVDLKNSTLDGIEQLAVHFSEQHNDITVSVTGSQFLFKELNQSMISGQTASIILAFMVIYGLLAITLKQLRVSFIALLPIAVSVVVLYGAMGLLGLSLNLITTTIFGITIGVGIDYAIHFAFIWNSAKKSGSGSEAAAQQALSYAARPIIANGFGIAIGLSALLFSPLQIHLYVAEMMWVSMLVSMILSLTFLPTLLRRLQ